MNTITKLWTRVPGTGYPTWKPENALTYMMGSYTATARYWSTWDHKGRFRLMIRGYTLTGPNLPAMFVTTLGDAKTIVLNRVRSR